MKQKHKKTISKKAFFFFTHKNMFNFAFMILKKITIINYKNIKEAELEFSPKFNCFIGNNGEGKTNFLDSIYYLSFTKSSTTSSDSLCVRHGEQVLMLQAEYLNNNITEEITCGIKTGTKKTFKRNKKSYKRMSEHIGLIPLVMISPYDTDLISGGSENRRKFIDSVISQYDKNYLDSLIRYNNTLQQRNAMLKADTEPNQSIIDIYDEIMALEGEKIYNYRKDFINDFTPIFNKYHKLISQESENVGIEYISHCQRGALIDILKQSRVADRAVGYSLHGIHKDDICFNLDSYPLKREGSQGQNKTCLIALKLAQYEHLRNTSVNTAPILLLDDIFDKLDTQRVKRIISIVSDDSFGQIFITDTNRLHLDSLLENQCAENKKVFHVTNGIASPIY